MKFLIGCDPEVFMQDPNSGQYVSAWGRIQGTKHEPYKIRNGAVQVDGNALEFNIVPADNSEKFVANVTDVFNQLKAMVPGYNVLVEPSVVFDPSYFNSLPEEAKELGCNPDFNAYTGDINPAPDGASTTMRTASGHIHIGWHNETPVDPFDPNHFQDCIDVVKQLDYYLGIWSLGWDRDVTRRTLYGKAGAFRPKPYGVEYRTLSNAWLKNPDLARWVCDAALKAVDDLRQNNPRRFVAIDHVPFSAAEYINRSDFSWRGRWGNFIPGLTDPPGAVWDEKKPTKKSKMGMA